MEQFLKPMAAPLFIINEILLNLALVFGSAKIVNERVLSVKISNGGMILVVQHYGGQVR
jgi:hypothetical protein